MGGRTEGRADGRARGPNAIVVILSVAKDPFPSEPGSGIGFGLKVRTGTGMPVALNPLGNGTIRTGVKVTPVIARHAEASYDKAVAELQIILDQNRGTMDTATVRVLESSLARIDAALAEAQKALESDPHSAYLNDHLSRIKRKKLDLLRQGASLVQAS